jgi:hypothetical protein
MRVQAQTKDSARKGGSLPQSTDRSRILFARFLADLLDQRFTIPGTSIRIGLDPILGLIPGIGDALANIAGSAILLIAAQFNVPKIILIRMGLNVAGNALIGAIPIIGDIFSIWFRSNARNADYTFCSGAVSAELLAATRTNAHARVVWHCLNDNTDLDIGFVCSRLYLVNTKDTRKTRSANLDSANGCTCSQFPLE